MKAPISVDGKVFHAAPRTHLASPPLISVTEVCNELTGGLPRDLPLGLEELILSLNNLVGTIPSTLGNITLLNKFICMFNGLDGGIPGELAALREMELLDIGGNRFSGGFPEAILNMSSLVRLDLDTNHFRGKMPSGIGSSLPNLRRFFIGGNFFQGNSTTSVAINGTIGYVAPECAVGGQDSTASDVYSFGVILLEIFIRRRPIDEMFKDGLSIAMYTEMNIPDKILQIIDPQLVQELGLSQEDLVTADENAAHCLLSVMSIGLYCTKSAPSDRISMQEVSAKLHAVKDSYLR
nr:unnamed protein product [Digitaria exilis]